METSHFQFGNKPYGIPGVSSVHQPMSYQSWLEKYDNQKLYACSELEDTTTGAILLAKNAESFKELQQQPKNSWTLEYLFITDKTPAQKSWTHSCDTMDRYTNKKYSSETHFELIETHNGYCIIKARTQSLYSHHIRMQAKASNIPLLGDTQYSGTPYPFIFLHCQSLSLSNAKLNCNVAPPLIFKNLQYLKEPLLVHWLMSVDRRERLYKNLRTSSYRWIHDEGTPLRLDVLSGIGCAGWWREQPPSPQEVDLLKKFFTIMQIDHWRLMHHSGKRNQDQCLFDSIRQDAWDGKENKMRLNFRKESGLSCGLFLDQRDNRDWLEKNASGKNILNLFAYTGAFSVAAALGKAAQVTTVDLSKNYIDWCKHNFTLNTISTEKHLFYSMDTFDYLKYANKKQIFFDIVICDPPSFSRDKKGKIFKIEKDFKSLLEAICKILSPTGCIFFSTNYEGWTASQWILELQIALSAMNLTIKPKLSFQWDFEMTGERHMKAFLLKKK